MYILLNYLFLNLSKFIELELTLELDDEKSNCAGLPPVIPVRADSVPAERTSHGISIILLALSAVIVSLESPTICFKGSPQRRISMNRIPSKAFS